MLLKAAPGLKKDHYVSCPPAVQGSKAIPGVGCPLAGRCRARSATYAPRTAHLSRSRLPASSAAIYRPKHWYATPPRHATTASRSR
ncbi:hypothetical protein [Sinorhizobium meliloti]|uniref:hypothetical protein n=1 Tax=Rhizobium meliloti TaxID=382 RepID=UPI001F4680FF|nr:hypothetical protein [Sinorhizobium meliloti]